MSRYTAWRSAARTATLLLAAWACTSQPARAAAAPGPRVIQRKYVYRNPTTGAETPVDDPSPQWFADHTGLKVGQPYTPARGRTEIARFLAEHGLLCRAVRPEPLDGGVRVVFVFEKRKTAWLVRVAARQGAPAVPATELMEEAVSLRRGRPVSRARLDADRRAIVHHLRQQGYHFAAATAHTQPTPARAGAVDVRFLVDRGPRVRVAAITIVGNRALKTDELAALMHTRRDRWYRSGWFVKDRFDDDVKRLREHYIVSGWEDAQLSAPPVLFDAQFVRIEVDTHQKGARRIVRRVRVSGNDAVGTSAIRRAWQTRPGRPFRRDQLLADIAWLRARYARAGLTACPADLVVRDDPDRTVVNIAFGRARQVVTLRLVTRQGPAGSRILTLAEHTTTGPFMNGEIAAATGLRPGQTLSEAAIPAAIDAVTRLYTQTEPLHHYAPVDTRVTETPAETTVRIHFVKKGPSDRTVAAYLRLRVNEGARYRVESITFSGVRPLFEGHIRDRLAMLKGAYYTELGLQKDRETVRRVYHEKGFPDVKVRVTKSSRVRPDEKVFDLTYTVTEGPLCYVNLIRPRGNDKTKPQVIVREMPLKGGDRYDVRKIQAGMQRLRNLRYFDKVDWKAADSPRKEPGKNYKDIYVQVREASTRKMMLGAGVGSVSGVFGLLGLRDSNFDLADTPRSWEDFVSGTAFAGGGQELGLYLQPGSNASQYVINWTEPWLNDRPVELGVSGGYFLEEWDKHEVDRIGGQVRLGKRFSPTLTGFLGLRFHHANVSDISRTAPPDVWDDRGGHDVLGLSAGLTHQTLDRTLFPTTGHRTTALAELIGTPVFEAVKLVAEGRWFFTLYEADDKTRQVVSLWGDLGLLAGGELPVFERFYAGGLGSVRGFAAHGISPLNNTIYAVPPRGAKVPVRRGDAVGGRFKMQGGIEYLFPIVKDRVRGVLFLDAGSVAKSTLGVGSALSDLRASTGVGVQFVIPQLGKVPISMYLGLPIRKQGGDDTEAFAFSIGVFLP